MLQKAVIPLGWTGRHLVDSAPDLPAELLPVLDRPAILHVVEEAVLSGAEEIILLGGPGLRLIEDDLGGLWAGGQARCDIRVVPYAEAPGMGQAALRVRSVLDQAPFGWLQPDVLIDAPRPCLGQLAARYHDGTLIAVHPADAPDAEALPLVQTMPGDAHRVADLVLEETDACQGHRLALTGRHILHPDVLAALAEVPPGPGDLISALRLVAHAGRAYCRRFLGAPFSLRTAHGWMRADLAMAGRRGT